MEGSLGGEDGSNEKVLYTKQWGNHLKWVKGLRGKRKLGKESRFSLKIFVRLKKIKKFYSFSYFYSKLYQALNNCCRTFSSDFEFKPPFFEAISNENIEIGSAVVP